VEQVLAKKGLFRGVSDCSPAAIVSHLQQSTSRSTHTVFAEGEPADRLYIIVACKVVIGRRATDGPENLVSVIGPRIFSVTCRSSMAAPDADCRHDHRGARARYRWILVYDINIK
jgi:hypothetical protein